MSTPKIVNKSGVVLTKDGQRLFGMDAAHYVKMQAKEDPEWDRKVLAWLSALLGEPLGSEDLWAVLKNGTVLIRAVNTLKPGAVPRYNRARLVPLLEMDNIQLYLKACWNLGVPSECMFTSAELYKRQDMSKVTRNIEALSKLAANFGCSLPPLDSAKKEKPKQVSLVDEGPVVAPADPVELVTQLRDKIDKKKSECAGLEAEESGLREELKQLARAWREEKLALTYALSGAEKNLRSGGGGGAGEEKKKAEEKPQPSFSAEQRRELSEALERERRLAAEADERRKKLEAEEAALAAENARLRQQLAEREKKKPKREEKKKEEEAKPPEQAAAAAAPEKKRLAELEGAGGLFYERDVASPDVVAHLSGQLAALLRGGAVPFEDLFRLRALLERDPGRRLFCFVLFQQVRSTRKKAVVLSGDGFDLVLWLFNTVLQGLALASADAGAEKMDFFATRVLLKYSARLLRERPAGLKGARYESIQQFIRGDAVWRNLSFWNELFLTKVGKRQKKSGAKKKKKSLPQVAEKMLLSMAREWQLPQSFRELFLLGVAEHFSASELARLRKALAPEASEALEAPEAIARSRSASKLELAYATKQIRQIFGQPLRPRKGAFSLESGEKKLDPAEGVFPEPVWQMICELERSERCLACPGIFRESGDAEALRVWRAKIEAGEAVDFATMNPHELGALLKLWLRELPEPLFTFDAYSIVQTAELLPSDQQKVVFVRRLLSRLPDANRAALGRLLALLRRVAARSAQNKMTERNLAVVFAPALFRERVATVRGLADAGRYADILLFLISNPEAFGE